MILRRNTLWGCALVTSPCKHGQLSDLLWMHMGGCHPASLHRLGSGPLALRMQCRLAAKASPAAVWGSCLAGAPYTKRLPAQPRKLA